MLLEQLCKLQKNYWYVCSIQDISVYSNIALYTMGLHMYIVHPNVCCMFIHVIIHVHILCSFMCTMYMYVCAHIMHTVLVEFNLLLVRGSNSTSYYVYTYIPIMVWLVQADVNNKLSKPCMEK